MAFPVTFKQLAATVAASVSRRSLSTAMAPYLRPAACIGEIPGSRRVPHHRSSGALAHEDFLPSTWDASSDPPHTLSDSQLLQLIEARKLSVHRLEDYLGDHVRAVDIRRQYTALALPNRNAGPFDNLPFQSFNTDAFYQSIHGTNCEAVVGYVPLPVGVVGPVMVNNEAVTVPMATTEGALIASTNRGARVMSLSGGAHAEILKNGMTRAPLLRVGSVKRAAELSRWVMDNTETLTKSFNSTTNFGKLQSIDVRIGGRNVYVRFACHCGDAMGMNMVTKGTSAALGDIVKAFPDAEVISLSGNLCSDKKPAAVNWIQGRGRSVICEVTLKKEHIEKVLHTTAKGMEFLNVNKNLIGSAMAGSVGGFNAHASNIVSAVFLATGNDPAQNVESSSCMTLMEEEANGDLHVSVTMPTIEVGTVGGGTTLPAQRACLDIMGCGGASRVKPGANADKLACAIAATVLAGEISLVAALSTGDLLESHLRLNRKKDGASATIGHPSSGGGVAAVVAATTGKKQFSTMPILSAAGMRFARAAGEHAFNMRFATPANSVNAGPFQDAIEFGKSPAMHHFTPVRHAPPRGDMGRSLPVERVGVVNLYGDNLYDDDYCGLPVP